MKIAIATENSCVAQHFGRCSEYTLIDIENSKVVSKEMFANPGHEPGRIPQELNAKSINCIIAGGMGPRAVQLFNQYKIEAVLGVTGSVDVVIDQILNGVLKGGESLCVVGSGKGTGIEKTVCDHAHEDDSTPDSSEICHHQGIIAITANGMNKDADMDPRFGRCEAYCFYNTVDQTCQFLKNPYAQSSDGAGIQAASFLAGKNVKVVIAGKFGPNATTSLNSAGIEMIEYPATSSVGDTIAHFSGKKKA